MSDKQSNEFHAIIKGVCNNIVENFDLRVANFQANGYSRTINQCIGGLLSRQCTLALEILNSPNICNQHIAPIFMRCMIEIHISLCWILQSPEERTKKYVDYGIGQAKLRKEHMKKLFDSLDESISKDEKDLHDKAVNSLDGWISAQLNDPFIQVDVGSWHGTTFRNMAKETNNENMYNLHYTAGTAAIHSTWDHVGRFNASICNNPLHKYHFIPSLRRLNFDGSSLEIILYYLGETLSLFEINSKEDNPPKLPLAYFYDKLSDE